MADKPAPTPDNLPLVPEDVLQQHNVHEKYDTRFRSCARLLQSIWREQQGLPIGTFIGKDAKPRKIGSLIDSKAAITGRKSRANPMKTALSSGLGSIATDIAGPLAGRFVRNIVGGLMR